MASQSGVWNCHPDLQSEWKKFIEESQKSARSNLHSDLWMNFWRCEAPTATTTTSSETEATGLSQDCKQENLTCDNNVSSSSQENMQVETEAAVPLTDSMLRHINSIALDLLDALDMEAESIPGELKDDVRSLSLHGMTSLLNELRTQLSDQAAYSFCTLLCEDVDGDAWIDVATVFKHLFLPMVCGDGSKSLGEEVKAGLKQLTQNFPPECVSHFLKPLLTYEPITSSHLELLSELIPTIPKKDFLCLLRYFVHLCSAPLQEKKISVLTCLLSGVKPEVLESKAESPLLRLIPVLSSSARELSANEPFAGLLLRVIPLLRGVAAPQVQSELLTIVQQNRSFNKQALVNVLKSVGM